MVRGGITLKKLESYSKQEILEAIRFKQKFDHALVPTLERILAQFETDKAMKLWENAANESQNALNEWIRIQQETADAHGGEFRIADLSNEEVERLAEAAGQVSKTEETEKRAYKHLKRVQDAQTKGDKDD